MSKPVPGTIWMQHRQTPQCCRKSASKCCRLRIAYISRALLWFGGLDRTAPRRKARRGGGWERPPPARYALRHARGEGSVACSVARQTCPPEGVAPIEIIPAGRLRGEPLWTTTHGRGRGRGTAPVSFLEDALSRVSPGLLYALVAALSVELAAVLLLDFPAFGLVPILDLMVSIEISAFLRRDPGLVLPRSGRRRLRGEPRPRRSLHSLFQPRGPRGIRPPPRRRHGGAGGARAGPELACCVLSGRWHRGLWMGRARPALPPARGESDPGSRRPRRSTGLLHDPAVVSRGPRPRSVRRRADSLGELACVAGVAAGLAPGRARNAAALAGRQADDAELQLVLGELHHPTYAKEVAAPQWLTLPERGLFTGIAIFGAVGSGKTSACMHPYARQIFHWRADDPKRRAAGLVLEVKGDFCHDVRRILENAGRGDDYIEIALGGSWQWNPLDYGYGQLLPGLQRRISPQSAFREGQGAVLAAGLHEPDPVDHRAPPDAAWRVVLRSAISTVVPSTRSSSARRSRRHRSHRRGRHRPGPSTSRSMAGSSSFSRTPSSLVTSGRRAGPASCGPPTTRIS